MSKNKYHVWTSIEQDDFFPVFAKGYRIENGFFRFDDDTAVRADIVERIECVAFGYEYGDVAKEMNSNVWKDRGRTEEKVDGGSSTAMPYDATPMSRLLEVISFLDLIQKTARVHDKKKLKRGFAHRAETRMIAHQLEVLKKELKEGKKED